MAVIIRVEMGNNPLKKKKKRKKKKSKIPLGVYRLDMWGRTPFSTKSYNPTPYF